MVNKKKKAELVEELEMMMYDKLPKTKTSAAAAAAIVQTDENTSRRRNPTMPTRPTITYSPCLYGT